MIVILNGEDIELSISIAPYVFPSEDVALACAVKVHLLKFILKGSVISGCSGVGF